MRRSVHFALFALSLVLLAGCGRPADELPADTGSRDAARAFFDAVGKRDWAAAHHALDPDSRRACSSEELARRGAAYLKQVGFAPSGVKVPVCEERGDEATAHVTLTGHGHNRREFKDAVTLRRRDGKWAVVLPAGFGRP